MVWESQLDNSGYDIANGNRLRTGNSLEIKSRRAARHMKRRLHTTALYAALEVMQRNPAHPYCHNAISRPSVRCRRASQLLWSCFALKGTARGMSITGTASYAETCVRCGSSHDGPSICRSYSAAVALRVYDWTCAWNQLHGL